MTIRELHHIIPEVSKTTIHEAVTEKLRYRKLCARWVPKMLTDDHKTKRSFVRRELLFSEHQPQQQVTNSTYANKAVRVEVAVRSKAWVCGCLLAGIVGTNPVVIINLPRDCCVLSGMGSCSVLITRPEDSS